MARIELLLQIGDGVVHHVILALYGGVGQLFLREEVRHFGEFENVNPVSQA